MMGTGIREFLLARIAEDEAVARAAVSKDGRWSVGSGLYDPEEVSGDIHIYAEGGHTAEQAAHIARHDPARVLVECAAKRAIVAECRDATVDDVEWGDVPVPPWVTRALAAVYSDHPDYQDEWSVKSIRD